VLGGLLGGKAGIVNFHMGDAKNPFQTLYDMVEKSELSFAQFLPTHCNRNDDIFEDAKKYGKKGSDGSEARIGRVLNGFTFLSTLQT